MPTIFIDGEAGTTGLGIRQRLTGLSSIKLLSIPEADRKNPAERQKRMQDADLIILCLPDAASREAVALAAALGPDAPRVLDASTAYRIDPDWTFGFPEMTKGQADKIRVASYVSNPGCYSTGAIALLRPLIEAGKIAPHTPLTINAVSGYSGGGKSLIEMHEAEGGPAFDLYGLGLQHKHVPEIEIQAGLSRPPVFVPSVGHFRQGMLVSIPLHLDTLPRCPTAAELAEVLAAHYAEAPEIEVSAEALTHLEPETLNDTNRMSLHVFTNEARRHALLVARLDNLGKGASGAAVQNVKLMLGLEG